MKHHHIKCAIMLADVQTTSSKLCFTCLVVFFLFFFNTLFVFLCMYIFVCMNFAKTHKHTP